MKNSNAAELMLVMFELTRRVRARVVILDALDTPTYIRTGTGTVQVRIPVLVPAVSMKLRFHFLNLGLRNKPTSAHRYANDKVPYKKAKVDFVF